MELITEFLAAPADAGCLVLEAPALSSRPMVFVPLLRRTDGILAAVPIGALADAMVDAGQTGGLDLTVGPSCQVSAGLAEEDDEGALQPTGEVTGVLVVDFSEEVVQHLSRYDPVTSPSEATPFLSGSPHLMPVHSGVLAAAREWVASLTGERMAFYSAAEELDAGIAAPPEPAPKRKVQAKAKRATNAQLAEQLDSMLALLPALAQQVQDLSSRQTVLEAKAKGPPSNKAPASDVPLPHRAAFPIGLAPHTQNPLGSLRGLVGPPPKVRAPVLQHPPPPLVAQDAPQEELGQDPITGEPLVPAGTSSFADAMLRQSQALGTLVSHLVAQADAGESSLGPASGSLLGTRGAAKRERLQEQLAARSGSFLLQVSQQALRRLAPADQVPQTREDLLHRRPLFTEYAERFGGFGGQRSLGIVFWLLANIADTMLSGDHVGAEELLALSLIAVEQAAQDNGSWDIGYLLSLQEDPPHQLFQRRPQSQNPRLRAFGGLTPQPWAMTTLSYIREIDVIQGPAVGDDFRDQGKSLGIRAGCIYACTAPPATVPQEGQRLCCSSGLGLAPSRGRC